jgi:hypothetical protein
MYLPSYRDQWWTLVNTVMKLRVPHRASEHSQEEPYCAVIMRFVCFSLLISYLVIYFSSINVTFVNVQWLLCYCHTVISHSFVHIINTGKYSGFA